jgi:hypothetical protein
MDLRQAVTAAVGDNLRLHVAVTEWLLAVEEFRRQRREAGGRDSTALARAERKMRRKEGALPRQITGEKQRALLQLAVAAFADWRRDGAVAFLTEMHAAATAALSQDTASAEADQADPPLAS